MRYSGRIAGFFLGTILVLATVYASSVGAMRLVSPNYRLDSNAAGSFGGKTSSTSYKMTSIGGEAVVGDGASGSYKIGQGYGTVGASSMQLSLQPSGLAYYFPFNENTGTATYDVSAANASATLSGSPSWVTGKLGSALLFDGVSGKATVASAPAVTSGRMSLTAWVKVSSVSNANTYQTLFECQNGETDRLFNVWVNKLTGKVGASTSFSGTPYVTSSDSDIRDSSWHYVVYTIDDSRINIYLDGQLEGYAAYSGTLDVPVASLKIADGRFNGTIDDFRVFNRTLSAGEVSRAYTAQSAGVVDSVDFGSLAGGVSSFANVDAVVQTNTSIYSLAINQDHNMQTAVASGATPDRSESFDGVVPGATLTNTNTSYNDIIGGTGASHIAANDSPIHGTFGRYNPGTSTSYSFGRFDLSGAPAVVYTRLYFRIPALPVGRDARIMYINDTSNVEMMNIKVMTSGHMALTNLNSTAATGSLSVPTNEWIRAELLWDRPSSTQTLRMYYGANVEGATPDETITSAAGGSATANRVAFGATYVQGSGYTVDMDETATATTGWIGSVVPVTPDAIPAIPSSISAPASWSEGLTNGLGFSVASSPAADSRWDGGSKYAKFPLTSTTFYTQLVKSDKPRDVIGLSTRVSIRGDQAQGAYSNTVTVTGTTLP